ncbi:MAG: ferrous iron transport protein A [Planctomycetaceae bacterium]|jgi:Fe2+ transport system protein FeoA|nr:ferrous iron transport protein A [Planctomycetaceae bacterium]
MLPVQDIERGFRSGKTGFLHGFPCGQSGTIVEMPVEPELQGCLMGMGLFAGTRFHLIRGGISQLPFLLAVGETRIAVDAEIAKRIVVEA